MFGCVGYCLFGGFGCWFLYFLDYDWCRFVWLFTVAGLWWIAFALLDILFSVLVVLDCVFADCVVLVVVCVVLIVLS